MALLFFFFPVFSIHYLDNFQLFFFFGHFDSTLGFVCGGFLCSHLLSLTGEITAACQWLRLDTSLFLNATVSPAMAFKPCLQT